MKPKKLFIKAESAFVHLWNVADYSKLAGALTQSFHKHTPTRRSFTDNYWSFLYNRTNWIESGKGRAHAPQDFFHEENHFWRCLQAQNMFLQLYRKQSTVRNSFLTNPNYQRLIQFEHHIFSGLWNELLKLCVHFILVYKFCHKAGPVY